MAESKRTFTRAKINRDIEEKILPPGEYRDALNISVDFSEDGNVGAIENLKGNELIANQNIYGLTSATNPNATVVGSYPHPEEKKIYYFVTGDKADGIFEYDIEANEINTILIDSVKASVVETINLAFEDAGVTGSVAQDGSISLTARIGANSVEAITEDFSANETGSAVSRKITVSLKAPSPYTNQGELLIGSITASQPSKLAPEVITKNIVSKTETTATLLGSLTNNSVGVTAQGFYYGYNTGGTALTINELKTGGAGITNLSTSVTPIKNNFTADITSLPSSKLISYAAFATNSVGTTDGSVLTFTTDTPPPINRISGTEYVVVPVIEDTVSGNLTDEVDNRNVGYGSFFKTSGDCYLNISAPASDGVYANATDVSSLSSSASFTSTPSGLTFASAISGAVGTRGNVYVAGFAANTSYEIGVPSISGITAKTIRINNGTPSGTYYTSTLNLNLSGVFVGKLDSGGYQYNTAPNPSASYILGPVAAGETAQAIIPLNNLNTLLTAVADTAFKSSFDPENLTVTVTGKTEGTDFDYYVEDSSTAMFGIVPGIIFVGTPELLGSTPTVNITYTP
jgi:hypothetical protein